MIALKTTVEKDGQPFVDKPIYARPKQESAIESGVREAFKRRGPIPILIAHERVLLQWMKSDGKGSLVPR